MCVPHQIISDFWNCTSRLIFAHLSEYLPFLSRVNLWSACVSFGWTRWAIPKSLNLLRAGYMSALVSSLLCYMLEILYPYLEKFTCLFFILNTVYFRKCCLQIMLIETPHFCSAVEIIQIRTYMSNLNV